MYKRNIEHAMFVYCLQINFEILILFLIHLLSKLFAFSSISSSSYVTLSVF